MSDEAPGGSKVCHLDEADAAYRGYLTDAELRRALGALRDRALALGATGALARRLAAFAARLDGVLAGLPAAAPPGDPDAAPAPPPRDAAALAEALAALLPRVASDARHAALAVALGGLREPACNPPRTQV